MTIAERNRAKTHCPKGHDYSKWGKKRIRLRNGKYYWERRCKLCEGKR